MQPAVSRVDVEEFCDFRQLLGVQKRRFVITVDLGHGLYRGGSTLVLPGPVSISLSYTFPYTNYQATTLLEC